MSKKNDEKPSYKGMPSYDDLYFFAVEVKPFIQDIVEGKQFDSIPFRWIWETHEETLKKLTEDFPPKTPLTERDLKRLHKRDSTPKALRNATSVGCFYCITVSDVSAVKEFVGDNYVRALCPNCCIDSVLPDVTDLEVLKQMRKFWFW